MDVTENHVFFLRGVMTYDMWWCFNAFPARWNFDEFWGSEAFLRLPMDAMPSGRLLPLARFIQSPLQGTIGKEAEISVFDPTLCCL